MHDGTPYLVMQVLDGTSLADLASDMAPLPTAVVCTVAFGIAEALEAAHAAGVLHRDVKPTNVGITRSGRVVLQDFGLARLAGEAAITRTGAPSSAHRSSWPPLHGGHRPAECPHDPRPRPPAGEEATDTLLLRGTWSAGRGLRRPLVGRRLAGLLQESGNHLQACEVLKHALDMSERGRPV